MRKAAQKKFLWHVFIGLYTLVNEIELFVMIIFGLPLSDIRVSDSSCSVENAVMPIQLSPTLMTLKKMQSVVLIKEKENTIN